MIDNIKPYSLQSPEERECRRAMWDAPLFALLNRIFEAQSWMQTADEYEIADAEEAFSSALAEVPKAVFDAKIRYRNEILIGLEKVNP